MSALVFLYRNVLESEIGLLDGVVRAKRPARLPVVLTRHEARQLFAKMDGVVLLACRLLYGSGLRLLECLHLRVKDIESRRLPNTRIVTPAAATGITCMNPSSRGKGHAVRLAGITKPATPRAIRHSFATERLRKGHDIRTIQQLLGNSDVSTTMIHTHVLNRGRGVQSPADDL